MEPAATWRSAVASLCFSSCWSSEGSLSTARS